MCLGRTHKSDVFRKGQTPWDILNMRKVWILSAWRRRRKKMRRRMRRRKRKCRRKRRRRRKREDRVLEKDKGG